MTRKAIQSTKQRLLEENRALRLKATELAHRLIRLGRLAKLLNESRDATERRLKAIRDGVSDALEKARAADGIAGAAELVDELEAILRKDEMESSKTGEERTDGSN